MGFSMDSRGRMGFSMDKTGKQRVVIERVVAIVNMPRLGNI